MLRNKKFLINSELGVVVLVATESVQVPVDDYY